MNRPEIVDDTISITPSILISILLGIVLGIIVYKLYINPPMIKGPNSKDIVGKIFEVDGKHYEFVPIVCGCISPNLKIYHE
jgi:hypothetical protein